MLILIPFCSTDVILGKCSVFAIWGSKVLLEGSR